MERARSTEPYVFAVVDKGAPHGDGGAPPHLVVAALVRAARESAASRLASFTADTWSGVAIVTAGLLLLLQIYLVAAHLAGDIVWRWAATLAPVWALDAAVGASLVAYLLLATADRHSDADADEMRDTKIKVATALVLVAMLFASEVMLVDKLDGREAHSWQALCGPLYAAAGVVAAFGVSLVWHNWPDEDAGGGGGGGGGGPTYVV